MVHYPLKQASFGETINEPNVGPLIRFSEFRLFGSAELSARVEQMEVVPGTRAPSKTIYLSSHWHLPSPTGTMGRWGLWELFKKYFFQTNDTQLPRFGNWYLPGFCSESKQTLAVIIRWHCVFRWFILKPHSCSHTLLIG